MVDTVQGMTLRAPTIINDREAEWAKHDGADETNTPSVVIPPQYSKEETPIKTTSVIGVLDTKDKVPDVTVGEALVAGAKNTLWYGAGTAYAEDWKFTADPDFDIKPFLDDYTKQYNLTDEEVASFEKVKSLPQMKHHMERVLDKRSNDFIVSQRPVVAFAGGVVDADLALGGIGKLAGAGRIANAALSGTAVASVYADQGANILGGNALLDTVLYSGIGALTGNANKVVNATPSATPNVTPQFTPYVPNAETLKAQYSNLSPNVQQSASNLADKVMKHAESTNLSPEELAKKAGTYNKPKSVVGRYLEGKNWWNKYTSLWQSHADYISYLSKHDENNLVNKLFKNTATRDGDDVVSRQTTYSKLLGGRIRTFENALADTVTGRGISSNIISRWNGKFREGYLGVSKEFTMAQQQFDQLVVEHFNNFKRLPTDAEYDAMLLQLHRADGTPMPSDIHNLIKVYMKSGFAEDAHDMARQSGMLKTTTKDANGKDVTVDGMDDILRRPSYFPVKQDYANIDTLIRTGKATEDEIAKFVGRQIGKQYPSLLRPIMLKGVPTGFQLTESQLGKHFIRTQEDAAKGNAISSTGFTKEQFEDLFTKVARVDSVQATQLAEAAMKQLQTKGSGVTRNHRKRIGWNFFDKQVLKSGYTLTMADIVSPNALGNLEDYTRTMSSRFGLADYGIRTEAELDKVFDSLYKTRPQDMDVSDLSKIINDSKDMLLGRPSSSQQLPAFIRGSQKIADTFLLANSGLYGLMEVVTTVQQLGLLRSIPHIMAGLKGTFQTVKGVTKAEANDLRDVLTQSVLQGGEWKQFTSRYSDNFAVGSGFAEAAEYYGQSARFMNLSEPVRRFQVNMMTSLYAKNLDNAMKGVASETKFMKNTLSIDDELFARIKAEHAKYGNKIDDWAAKTRVDYLNKVFHNADALATAVRTGELPTFMTNSAAMRVILPYMTFVFAAQNKVFRKVRRKDSDLGLALLLTAQIPTALLIASAINISKGKEYDEELVMGAMKAMTGMGALNAVFEQAAAGITNMGVTALTPFAKTWEFGNEMITGGSDNQVDPSVLLKNSPLSANILLRFLDAAFDEPSDMTKPKREKETAFETEAERDK